MKNGFRKVAFLLKKSVDSLNFNIKTSLTVVAKYVGLVRQISADAGQRAQTSPDILSNNSVHQKCPARKRGIAHRMSSIKTHFGGHKLEKCPAVAQNFQQSTGGLSDILFGMQEIIA